MMDQAPKTVTAIAVVNAFFHRAVLAKQTDFTPTKAQDLVFPSHAMCLATFGRRLTTDGFHADGEGIFSPSARSAGCVGTRRLDKLLTRMLPDGETGLLREQTPVVPSNSEVHPILDKVWAVWGSVPQFELREATRMDGSPWDLVWNDSERFGSAPRRVPDSTIRCWFLYAMKQHAIDANGGTHRLIKRPESMGTAFDIGDLRQV